MTDPDGRLLERAQGGDHAAFDLLCERYRAEVRAAVLRMLREPESADDVTQETLLRAWTHREQWSGSGSVRGWLLRIATNLALNYLQSDQRRRAHLPQTSLAPDEGGGRTDRCAVAEAEAPGALERAEAGRALHRLISELPSPKRDVVMEALRQDYDLERVSAALSLPRGTVKSRLHYARKALAARWKEETPEWEA